MCTSIHPPNNPAYISLSFFLQFRQMLRRILVCLIWRPIFDRQCLLNRRCVQSDRRGWSIVILRKSVPELRQFLQCIGNVLIFEWMTNHEALVCRCWSRQCIDVKLNQVADVDLIAGQQILLPFLIPLLSMTYKCGKHRGGHLLRLTADERIHNISADVDIPHILDLLQRRPKDQWRTEIRDVKRRLLFLHEIPDCLLCHLLSHAVIDV
jgi:hypothetical protein